MAERQNTQFQPNTTFNCTGRVAGFLNHHIMVHPHNSHKITQIVRDSSLTSPPTTTPTKQSSSDPRSKFMSPAKCKSDQLSEPVTPKASSDNGAPITTPSCKTLPISTYRIILIQYLSTST
ncbi:hypothetical protein GQ44DRAFT_710568 [Phaeosphaeriaceae sp. PMI808]|nr:hypothetical protein GQ44DRAFT_710568 [Phaeosphaeriaceae sp. PMI808]